MLISKKKRKTHSLFLLYVHTYLNAVLTASLLNIPRMLPASSSPKEGSLRPKTWHRFPPTVPHPKHEEVGVEEGEICRDAENEIGRTRRTGVGVCVCVEAKGL